MTAHLILAIIFISFFVLTIVSLFFNNDKDYVYKLQAICCMFSVFLFPATLVTGFVFHNYYNYREGHKPSLEDINDGNAVIERYQRDSCVYYVAKWIGTNQTYERKTNDIESCYKYKKRKTDLRIETRLQQSFNKVSTKFQQSFNKN